MAFAPRFFRFGSVCLAQDMVNPLLLERILADNGIGQHGIDRFYSLSHALPQIAHFLISFSSASNFPVDAPDGTWARPYGLPARESPPRRPLPPLRSDFRANPEFLFLSRFELVNIET